MQRREFLQHLGAAGLLAGTAGCASIGGQAQPQVVIIGGGYAGATAARYLRIWSEGKIGVTLVEPNTSFISCPLSNLVLGGNLQLSALTMSHQALQTRHGVRVLHTRAKAIDAKARRVQLENGDSLSYERLILAPGIDFMYEALPGLQSAAAQQKILHAWKAGEQTLALRAQLAAMPDGGVYAITVPLAPYRCPPGPYERACQVAHYFKQHKPKSKVLILDANPDVTSKAGLFKKVWAERYKGIVEYQPKFVLADVDVAQQVALSEFGDKVKADVLNVVPPQRAGQLALQAGLANVNQRWCEVDFLSMESKVAPNIHVLGDAIQIAPLMPKSAHMANQHGKICAAAIQDLLAGRAPNPKPVLTNTCYSFISDKEVIHVASVHTWDAEKKTLQTVPGSGGVSTAPTELEGVYAHNWAENIWADTLG